MPIIGAAIGVVGGGAIVGAVAHGDYSDYNNHHDDYSDYAERERREKEAKRKTKQEEVTSTKRELEEVISLEVRPFVNKEGFSSIIVPSCPSETEINQLDKKVTNEIAARCVIEQKKATQAIEKELQQIEDLIARVEGLQKEIKEGK